MTWLRWSHQPRELKTSGSEGDGSQMSAPAIVPRPEQTGLHFTQLVFGWHYLKSIKLIGYRENALLEEKLQWLVK